LPKIHPSVAIITAYDIKSTGRIGNANILIGGKISIGAQVRAIKFNHHHLVLWSFLGLSQWVYVRDDTSKGLKIMSLRVINHGMSLSVLYVISLLN
jgi:hypothetical protein